MSDSIPSLENLFDFSKTRRERERAREPEPPPPDPEPEKRRRVRGRLVRDLNAVKAVAQPDRASTDKSSAELDAQAAQLKEKFRAARQSLGAVSTDPVPPPVVAPPVVAPPAVAPPVAPRTAHRSAPRSTPRPARRAAPAPAPAVFRPTRAPIALEAPAIRSQPRVRVARIEVAEPEPVVEQAAHDWILKVLAGDEERSFFLRAPDMLVAASRGAVEIAAWMRAHRPEARWRVDSVELLSDVL